MSQDKINSVLWDIREEDRKALPTNFLIKRVLVYGGVFLIHDILCDYGMDKTKEVFESLKVSEVGKNRHYFFKNYLFI
jgi:hypothetical protein